MDATFTKDCISSNFKTLKGSYFSKMLPHHLKYLISDQRLTQNSGEKTATALGSRLVTCPRIRIDARHRLVPSVRLTLVAHHVDLQLTVGAGEVVAEVALVRTDI